MFYASVEFVMNFKRKYVEESFRLEMPDLCIRSEV